MQAVLVRSAYSDESTALSVSQRIIEKGLAACAHLSLVRSCYSWNGAIQDATEWVLEARCTTDQEEALVRDLAANHPYDVPMIESVATRVTKSYGDWMRSES